MNTTAVFASSTVRKRWISHFKRSCVTRSPRCTNAKQVVCPRLDSDNYSLESKWKVWCSLEKLEKMSTEQNSELYTHVVSLDITNKSWHPWTPSGIFMHTLTAFQPIFAQHRSYCWQWTNCQHSTNCRRNWYQNRDERQKCFHCCIVVVSSRQCLI